MPIYEYECEACGYHYETLQKVNDPVLTDCPKCTKPALKKLISAAGFRLSGSGWYETDFKSDNKRNLASADSKKKSESKEASKEAKKTESSSKESKVEKKKTVSSSKKDAKSSSTG